MNVSTAVLSLDTSWLTDCAPIDVLARLEIHELASTTARLAAVDGVLVQLPRAAA